MRILEVLLVLLLAGVAVCVLVGRWPRAGRLLLASALLVLVAHALFDGAHWQMIPAYAAAGILSLVAWRTGKDAIRWQRLTACSALLFAFASVIFSFVLPIFNLPEPTGTYSVGTAILYFKDTARVEDAAPTSGSPRELMVQLWYPAQPSHNRVARYRESRETNLLSSYQSVVPTHSRLDAPVAQADAPFKVILLNHAWGGRRTNDTFLTEELASHGYVVASIDDTYNARLVAFPDGRVVHGIASSIIQNPESSTEEQVKAIWNKELAKSVADQRFVLDRLEALNHAAGSPWFRRLDTNMAGALGHSFGGAAATAVCAADRRVHAAVNMDGWFFDAIRARGPNQQLLVMDAYTPDGAENSKSGENVEAALDASDFADVETSLHKFGGYLLLVNGAAHEDFTDQPLISPLRSLSHRGTLSANEIQGIVRNYVVAFFDKTLHGEDPQILRAHSSPFAEASLRAWPESENKSVSFTPVDGR